MVFCPKCGKKGITGTFCDDCAASELDLGFKDIAVKQCVECDRVQVRHKWQEFKDVPQGIANAAKTKIKNPQKLDIEVRPDYQQIKNKPGFSQHINLIVVVEGQEFHIPATIEHTYCNKCQKTGTEYFEGTLQLRDVSDEVIQYVREDVAKNVKEGIFVSKEKKYKNGIDLQMSSNKYMRTLAKKLKQKFGGEVVESGKLFTRNKMTSKEVYRMSVLFRQKKYKVGDIVESRGRKIKVTTIGNRVSGMDLETGKKVFVEED